MLLPVANTTNELFDGRFLITSGAIVDGETEGHTFSIGSRDATHPGLR